MLTLLLLLLQEPDAGEVLKSLEAKLSTAKTLQVDIQGESVLSRGETRKRVAITGSFTVKAPSKYLVAVTLERDDEKVAGRLVSDGERVAEKAGEIERELVPLKDFATRLGSLLARFGIISAQVLGLRNEDLEPQEKNQDFVPDARKLVTIEGAKAVKGKEGTTVTYTAVFRRRGEESETRAAVTLDLGADGFPVKRTMKVSMEAIAVEVTEKYSGWKLDAELADATFALPKK